MSSHDVVDSLIDEGSSLGCIRPYFATNHQAVQYFADHQTRKYAVAHATGRCCACEWNEGEEIVELRWAARGKLYLRAEWTDIALVVVGHIYHVFGVVRRQSIVFATYHPICGDCRRLQQRRLKLRPIVQSGIAVAQVAGIIMMTVGVLGNVFLAMTTKERYIFYAWAALGAVVIGCFGLLGWRANELLIPVSLRNLRRRQVRLTACRLSTSKGLVGIARGATRL